MKTLVLIGDGMADFPLAELDHRTPLEAAETPAMDAVVQRGRIGQFCPIPDDLPAGSDIGNLSLFGYDPHATFTGRAPLEAARQGIQLTPRDVAFRCNLVTLEDGIMANFTSGHISTEEAAQLIVAVQEACADLPTHFHSGVSYRHLTIIAPDNGVVQDLVDTACTPPHNISDRPIAPHLPDGPGRDLLLQIMERSQDVLRNHPVNQARIAQGQVPATSVWLWGQGLAPSMQTYQERFGISGAVISAVDLVKGIGTCAGLEVIDVPGATGYLDTNYEGKVAAALEALDRHDFVYLHVEAPDETAHEGRSDLKIQAIEDFDRRVVAPCMDKAIERDDCRVLVAPDHITAISTKTHAGGPVPFALFGPGVASDAAQAYSESIAQASGITIHKGWTLTNHIIQAAQIDGASLSELDTVYQGAHTTP